MMVTMETWEETSRDGCSKLCLEMVGGQNKSCELGYGGQVLSASAGTTSQHWTEGDQMFEFKPCHTSVWTRLFLIRHHGNRIPGKATISLPKTAL